MPRISIPLVLTEEQAAALITLAEAQHILLSPRTENDVIRTALRDVWVKHLPAIANPFAEE